MNTAKIIWLLGKLPVIGSLLRNYAKRFQEGSIVKIRHGYAAGFLWKRSHRYVNGYWIGQYELPMQEVMVRELKPGMTVFDIGANAGFFTLVAARLVSEGKKEGRVLACEPDPQNANYIRELIRINHLHYCDVVEEAVSNYMGISPFSFDKPCSSTGHLARLYELRV